MGARNTFVGLALVTLASTAFAQGALANGGLGSWPQHAPMMLARQECGAARIGGLVYVTGGLRPNFPLRASRTVEAYDIALNSWSFVVSMPVALDHMATTALAGKLYVMGGFSADFAARDELWIYDPGTNLWSPGAPLPEARGAGWAVPHGDRIYFFGGTDSFGSARNTTFAYHPASNTWSQRADMPTAREHLNAVALGPYVYVVGGRVGGGLGVNERYDPLADTWATMAPMPTARSAAASAAFGGRVYMMGGEVPVLQSVNEAYDPGTDTWSTLAPMPLPRHGVAAVALDDRILVPAGGIVQGLLPTALVDSFVPPAEPPPVVYCTAKINSLGCTPALAFTGTPSASDPSPFLISAAQVLSNKSGIFFYGLGGPHASPFQGGVLCARPPLRRTPVQDSAGNPPPDDCSGSYSFDFNALVQGGGRPGLGAGVEVHGQFWSRDPQSPSTTGLTDAVQFTICP